MKADEAVKKFRASINDDHHIIPLSYALILQDVLLTTYVEGKNYEQLLTDKHKRIAINWSPYWEQLHEQAECYIDAGFDAENALQELLERRLEAMERGISFEDLIERDRNLKKIFAPRLKPLNKEIKVKSIMNEGAYLLSEHEENEEYDRGITELVMYAMGYTSDQYDDVYKELRRRKEERSP
jgi:hypothetical protein